MSATLLGAGDGCPFAPVTEVLPEFTELLLTKCLSEPVPFEVDYEDVTHEFTSLVMPRDFDELYAKLRNFSGIDPTGKVVFVSQDVPEQWRPNVMRHAVLCSHFGKDAPPKACAKLTGSDINDLPPADRLDFARMRKEFFQSLVRHAPETRTIQSVKASLAFLRTAIQCMKDG